MKKIDKSGLILCELQAKTFELSAESLSMSSEIFIRRFMNSQISKVLDSGDILETNIQANDLLERVEEQYGPSNYGKTKFSADELYWIGYIYRYFSYTYEKSSLQVYKIVKPKELRQLYLPYHTIDPAQAIERILEAHNQKLDEDEEIYRQLQILKTIREKSADY
ncbi:hypothetical protein SAMN02745671_01361 [Anaerovibrio lipolyticus DSM 3074]|uniref:Antitoxin n=2 Tax=Anaerovibrio lipolyticus TaxID=82374 RepID=A0A0B2JWH6_9FIRM|nr:hypothetical protein [Anaerovibrio lipolyticus]KHM51068.1 antitoxin [Anaerovibrio lipolyticus]SHI69082.1 hypothetical protein SAMN02745671_01361 [Anaerovibrio lipolyticus DSM 3074]